MSSGQALSGKRFAGVQSYVQSCLSSVIYSLLSLIINTEFIELTMLNGEFLQKKENRKTMQR